MDLLGLIAGAVSKAREDFNREREAMHNGARLRAASVDDASDLTEDEQMQLAIDQSMNEAESDRRLGAGFGAHEDAQPSTGRGVPSLFFMECATVRSQTTPTISDFDHRVGGSCHHRSQQAPC